MTFRKTLLSLLVLVCISAVVEVGLIGTMVGFLHARAGKTFTVLDSSIPGHNSFELPGKPTGLMVNQGHTSNGAAGTALVLVGFGRVVVWFWERRAKIDHHVPKSNSPAASTPFTAWTGTTIISALLTLAALMYTFVVRVQTANQTISLSLAAVNAQKSPPTYPADSWTPETWFDAVLRLPLAQQSDRDKIVQELRVMRGWRWNLVVLLVLGVGVAGAAVWEWSLLRRPGRRNEHEMAKHEDT